MIDGHSIPSTISMTRDVLVLDKEHKWFERGDKEAIMSVVRNHLLTEEGNSDTTFQRPTTGRSGKYRDDFLVTSSPIHQSAIGHQISQPNDCTWICRYTVAINHSKSRRSELFLVFVMSP